MSGIRGKNTKPEMLLRRGLYARGLRYRLHVKDLPGSPDLVFPAGKAVLLAHGCFLHGHDCHLFRMPGSNPISGVRRSNGTARLTDALWRHCGKPAGGSAWCGNAH